MRISKKAAFLVLALGSCGDDGTAIEKACKVDADCPRKEMKCVKPAGVCVGFSTALGSDGGPPRDAGTVD